VCVCVCVSRYEAVIKNQTCHVSDRPLKEMEHNGTTEQTKEMKAAETNVARWNRNNMSPRVLLKSPGPAFMTGVRPPRQKVGPPPQYV
jgi:hypothetical protein